jgi:hypothetical protein
VKSVNLRDLPWEGWPYTQAPEGGDIIEGNIEQLLRLSRTSTVKGYQGVQASTNILQGSPEHYSVETDVYKNMPLENAYVIAVDHVGKAGKGPGYGRAVVSGSCCRVTWLNDQLSFV